MMVFLNFLEFIATAAEAILFSLLLVRYQNIAVTPQFDLTHQTILTLMIKRDGYKF